MKRSNKQLSGHLLVADFQTALLGSASADYARSAAGEAERQVVTELEQMSAGYLNPSNVGNELQQNISRASVNAHVIKVQAQQLTQMSQEQLFAMQADAQAYIGKKVSIQLLDAAASAFESVWFDSRSGYRVSPNNKKILHGRISEIDISKNLLVITPRKILRMIQSDLAAYFVYVIDPLTGQPAVTIDLA